jgi:hypothetical protein
MNENCPKFPQTVSLIIAGSFFGECKNGTCLPINHGPKILKRRWKRCKGLLNLVDIINSWEYLFAVYTVYCTQNLFYSKRYVIPCHELTHSDFPL